MPQEPAQAASTWFHWNLKGRHPVLHLCGAWRLASLPEIESDLSTQAWPASNSNFSVDADALQQIDSAAALVLLRHLQLKGGQSDLSFAAASTAPAAADRAADNAANTAAGNAADRAADNAADNSAAQSIAWLSLKESHGRILTLVHQHLAAGLQLKQAKAEKLITYIGRVSSQVAGMLLSHLNFLGATLAALFSVLLRPSQLRLRELTVQLEQCALNAVPVVSLVTLLIGVVVAYLLGLQAEKYGANIFVVDGVGVGATREFAPIIVAVVVAGRSGAAFTAQLGSMRLTEETDAIQTLGLDVWQVLVVPRVLALMVALPLLVFVGDVMSLLGAMFVSTVMLDLTPAGFLNRLQETLDLRHVVIGLAKAPVFALTIAVIATRMGMTVGRDTRAVGAATTSTVVQSIVAVILLDAAFAVLFQALGL